MTETNSHPENEEWLFNTLVDLEDEGLLGDYCRHLSIAVPVDATVIAEGIWPIIKERYLLADGRIDVTTASRELLAFRPLGESIADMFKKKP
jgi:hypothetical protein